MAIDYGIGRIIVDGIGELELIEDICKEKNKKVNILYRITPGIKADSHDYIITGKKDSKFGMPQDEEELYKEIKKAIDSQYVNFLGLHFHIGSQLFDNDPYVQAVKVALGHVKNIKDRYGYAMQELNLGGGFGAGIHNTLEAAVYGIPVLFGPNNLRFQAKYKKIEENEVRFEKIQCDDADYLIVAFGSMARIGQKAMELAREEGIKVGILRPITLWPFPTQAVAEMANQVKGMLVTELNAGQMVEDVRLSVGGKVKVEHFGRLGGIVPDPDEIVEALKAMI